MDSTIQYQTLDQARQRLLGVLADAEDVTFLRGAGNWGDDLIYAGTRQLLSCCDYREIGIERLQGASGHTALVAGSGSWCRAFHNMPGCLPQVEERFERVIVLPSSFDVSVGVVRRVLAKTKALVFAREWVSYLQIRDTCQADIAHDCALYFDFRPYQRQGRGTLNAFRTDSEAVDRPVPSDNRDISVACSSLDEWLWTIARCETVRTDRAHVALAGAMLGKRVEFASSNYHKVDAIVAYSLRRYDVSRIEETPGIHFGRQGSEVSQGRKPRAGLQAAAAAPVNSGRDARMAWKDSVERATEEIAGIVPEDKRLILVDEMQWGLGPRVAGRAAFPFLERGGEYWGVPADGESAIRELERLRGRGAEFIVFGWPAFWWLEHYSSLRAYLAARYRQVYRNERIVAFDIRP